MLKKCKICRYDEKQMPEKFFVSFNIVELSSLYITVHVPVYHSGFMWYIHVQIHAHINSFSTNN